MLDAMSSPYDPFEPQPSTPPPLPPMAATPQLPPYTFEGSWSGGIAIFKSQYPMLLAVTAIILVVQVVSTAINAGLEQIQPCLAGMWNIAITFGVSIPLSASYFLVGARAARGGKIDLNDLLLGYRRLGWIILWSLIVGCTAAALFIPGVVIVVVAASAGGESAAWITGVPLFLFYMALFMYLSSRLIFTTSMLVDPALPELQMFAAAKANWELTRSSWLSLIGLMLAVGLMLIGSLMLLCAGIVFVGYPLYYAIMGFAYATIVAPLVRQPTTAG